MHSGTIRLKDKSFSFYLREEQILERIRKMGGEISRDLEGREVIFLVILNGAFIFAADLLREVSLPGCQVTFLKLASYRGVKSTGEIRELLGLDEDLSGKTVVVVEDIIDTGRTLENIVQNLESHHPEEVRITSLLLKPDAFSGRMKIDYVGFEIPNDFIVGYGLDYDGLGRNLKDIYQVINE